MTPKERSRKKRKHRSNIWHYILAVAGITLIVMTMVFLIKAGIGGNDKQRLTQTEENMMMSESSLTDNKANVQTPDNTGPAQSPGDTVPAESDNTASATPADTPSPKYDDEARSLISRMSLEQKTAQLFIITPEALTGYSCVTQAGDATFKALQEYPVGGLIYFPQNLQNPRQLKEMTSQTQEFASRLKLPPLFLSIDEEGGKVARIANHEGFKLPKTEPMSIIGESKDTAKAYEAGAVIGTYLEDFGINLDFAPDADVLTNPGNTVVRDRSFGSDPELVTKMAEAYLKGLEDHNVYGTPKHFPGHGATEGDSHKGFAYTYKSWEELEKAELIPFAELIKDGTPFIMAGHISLPQITGDDTPSSLSAQVLTDYLRNTMGYEGIIITDALNMGAIQNNYPSGQAAVMALKAGSDMLLMPADFKEAYDGVLSSVRNGELTEERIDESLVRILSVKLEWVSKYQPHK